MILTRNSTRSRRSRFLTQLCVVAGLALAAAACASDRTVETVGDSSASELSVDTDGGLQLIIDPGADLTGSSIEVQCRQRMSFPASALDEIPLIADSGLTGVEEAIEPFLSSGEGDSWPQDGWRVLQATEDLILLVHLADPAPADGAVSFMSAVGSDGAWTWSGASGTSPCTLKTTLPEGLNSVDWELDPSAPAPDETATSFTVIANERNCVSGRAMGERLLGPEVVLTDDAVLLAFAATPPPGEFQDCPGNPSVAVTIQLDEPLGDREIRDGLDVGTDLAEFIN